jgi:CrcB protein
LAALLLIEDSCDVVNLAYIGLGGFAGAVSRYLLSGLIQDSSGSFFFPVGTLAVNVMGCFVIGVLSYLAESMGLFDARTRAFVLVGFLGSFTTFSSFSNEAYSMAVDGSGHLALLDIGLHMFLGLGGVWLGHTVAQFIWR